MEIIFHGESEFDIDETRENALVTIEHDIFLSLTRNLWELVCANFETISWISGYEIGDGYQNILDIIYNFDQVNNYNPVIVALAFIDFVSNGYSDWFTPSLNSLMLFQY